eukprot:s3024_g7.t1
MSKYCRCYSRTQLFYDPSFFGQYADPRDSFIWTITDQETLENSYEGGYLKENASELISFEGRWNTSTYEVLIPEALTDVKLNSRFVNSGMKYLALWISGSALVSFACCICTADWRRFGMMPNHMGMPMGHMGPMGAMGMGQMGMGQMGSPMRHNEKKPREESSDAASEELDARAAPAVALTVFCGHLPAGGVGHGEQPWVKEPRRGTYGTGVALVAALVAAGPGLAPRPFAWQAWHLATSAFVFCGKRGTR